MTEDLARLDAAAALVRTVVPATPQYCWPLLSRRIGAELWVKHENHTPIGAFKLRGGLTGSLGELGGLTLSLAFRARRCDRLAGRTPLGGLGTVGRFPRSGGPLQ